MVYPHDPQIRDRLEALYRRSPSVSVLTRFGEFFGQIGAAITATLTRDRSEPHISKFYTIEGKVLWHVFDPIYRQRFTFRSEGEVRTWLENRWTQ